MNIHYSVNKKNLEKIIDHLIKCDSSFTPPLSSTVDINQYSHKLFNHAERFEASESGQLVGLVAAYMNNSERKIGFITNVSVLKEYAGKSIATRLIEQCIHFAKAQGFKKVALEVAQTNQVAIALYLKMDFRIDQKKKKSNQLLMSKYL